MTYKSPPHTPLQANSLEAGAPLATVSQTFSAEKLKLQALSDKRKTEAK